MGHGARRSANGAESREQVAHNANGEPTRGSASPITTASNGPRGFRLQDVPGTGQVEASDDQHLADRVTVGVLTSTGTTDAK